MTDVVATLRAARVLIQDPVNWIQDQPAVDAFGELCASSSTRAVAWCSMGALTAVAVNLRQEIQAREALYRQLGNIGIAEFNDNSSHAEVLALFDGAIEAEAARQAEPQARQREPQLTLS